MNKIMTSVLALGLSAGTAFAAAHDVVRLGTEGAYAPYNFINDAGEIDGFERELGDELCQRAELTCEWVTNDWDSIIPNLISGNYDAIIAGMSVTDERKEKIDFTAEYTLPSPSSFAAASADIDVTAGAVAAQVNTIQASYLVENGIQLLEFATPEETIAAVRNGEADAVLSDKDFLEAIVAEDAELSFAGDDVYIGGGIGMGVRKSDTELRDKFSAAIESMKADGSLNALITKWLPGSGTF